MTDTERLDFLESLTTFRGGGWILRDSSTGRGMRLHETSQDGAQPTVRAAINAAHAELKACSVPHSSEVEIEKPIAKELATHLATTFRKRGQYTATRRGA